MLFLSAPSATGFKDEVEHAIGDVIRRVVGANVLQVLHMDHQSLFPPTSSLGAMNYRKTHYYNELRGNMLNPWNNQFTATKNGKNKEKTRGLRARSCAF
jgi:hypothetical protein